MMANGKRIISESEEEMKIIIALIVIVLWCNEGYGHDWESKHRHDSPTLIIREPSLQQQINELRAEVEELRKMVLNEKEIKIQMNLKDCGCQN